MCEGKLSLKRCCFCIPLRRGLIFWGYLKLVFCSLIMYPILMELLMMLDIESHHGKNSTIIGIIFVDTFFLLITSADLILNIMLVVAAHKKSLKMFRICFYYMTIVTVLYTLFWIIIVSRFVYEAMYRDFYIPSHYVSSMVYMFVTGLILLILQMYVIILLRIEIKKLGKHYVSRITNKEAQADTGLHLNHEVLKINEVGCGRNVEEEVDCQN